MPLPHLWADWYALESKVKMEILIFLAIILLPLTPLFLAIFWVQHRVPKGKRGMALKIKSRLRVRCLRYLLHSTALPHQVLSLALINHTSILIMQLLLNMIPAAFLKMIVECVFHVKHQKVIMLKGLHYR